MKVDCTWLEENFFKERLNDKQKQLVCEQFKATTYQKGDVIISQGEACKTVYIVYNGAVNIDSVNNGENIRVATATSGNLVGEMSFISETTASATVVAAEKCVLFKLTRKAFSEILNQDKGLVNLTFMNLLQHTARIIRKMNTEKASVQHYIRGATADSVI